MSGEQQPRWVLDVYGDASEILRLNLESEIEVRAAILPRQGDTPAIAARRAFEALDGRVARMNALLSGCRRAVETRRAELNEARSQTIGLFVATIWLVVKQRASTCEILDAMLIAHAGGEPIPDGWEAAASQLAPGDPVESVYHALSTDPRDAARRARKAERLQ